MALPDLTGINIENSYQRVVHTDGVNYYNGTGSLLNIGGTINTGSFATTGSNSFNGNQIISGSGIQVPLQVVSGSATLFHISSSNNVGFNQSASATTHVQFKSPYNSNIVEINTSANGQYGVRTDGIIKANNFYFYNTTGTIANASGVTLLGFNASNNIGVKTTTPTATLDVSGSVNISGSGTSIPFQISSGSTSLMYISSSGRVGIGTSTPRELLHVAGGNIALDGTRYIDFGSGNSRINDLGNIAGQGYPITISTFGPIGTGTANTLTEKLRLTGSGSLGLGTTSPSARFHISGGFTDGNLMRVQSSTGAEYFFISASGNVGIGIASPTAKLDVSGSARITNNAVITGSLLVVETNGNPRLDTSNGVLYRLGTASVDWRTRILNNGAGVTTVDWDSNQTFDSLGSSSIDWEQRILWDANTLSSVEYNDRRLRNSANDITLDWETGDLVGTASYANQALSASYAPGTPAFPFIGSAQITGSLSVSGSVTINNVDIQSTIVAMAIALG